MQSTRRISDASEESKRPLLHDDSSDERSFFPQKKNASQTTLTPEDDFDIDFEEKDLGVMSDPHESALLPRSTTKVERSSYDEEDEERQEEFALLDAPLPMPVTMPEAAAKPRHSTAYLDGLRGIAAVCVFNQHYITGIVMTENLFGFGESGSHYHFISLPFVRLLTSGSAAVTLFFIISGFVLSRSFFATLATEGGDARFKVSRRLVSAVVRRPFRLYLPVMFVTALFALSLHVPGLYDPQALKSPMPSLRLELWRWWESSYALYNPFVEHTHRIFQPYNIAIWSIPVEFAGSMLVYWLIALYTWIMVRTQKSVAHLHTAMCVFFATSAFLLIQSASWVNACFIAGMFLGYLDLHSLDLKFLEANFTERARRAFYIGCMVVGMYLLGETTVDGHPESSVRTPGWAMLTYMIPDHYYDSRADEYYRYWHSWGSFLLLYSVMRLPAAQRFLETRPARFLGRVSFMLYIFHEPVKNVLHDRLTRLLGGFYYEESVRPEYDLSWWNDRLWVPDIGPLGLSTRTLTQAGIVLAITLVIAHFAVIYIDEPSVRLSKRITRKLGIDRD